MKISDLETRVLKLEQAVTQLQSQANDSSKRNRWWETAAGRFEDDPVFDEIVELGREYRESLRPKSKARKGSRGDS